jgi:hypothetical protein
MTPSTCAALRSTCRRVGALGDKASGEYFSEYLLTEACSTELFPQRKKNSTRAVSVSARYLQQVYRKRIETTFRRTEQMLPKPILAFGSTEQ